MIREIRLLPPLVIARLGSAATPMDNYDVRVDPRNPLEPRQLVPARTLKVNRATGAITEATTPARVRFRQGDRVRPVAPFLEVWCDTGDGVLRPLTTAILAAEGLTAADVRWRARVGNVKARRRTRITARTDADRRKAEDDAIRADTGVFNAHSLQRLNGTSPNFVDGKSIPFGDVQYIRPTAEFPEIRLRFTPGRGFVYGATKEQPDANVQDIVYDHAKGRWSRYREPDLDDPEINFITAPMGIFANVNDVSRGYLDDACDGIIDVEITAGAQTLRSFARVGSGPPDYAPDSLPVRTIADDLEQALLGPAVDRATASPRVVEEILRRAFETVRLQFTAGINGNDIRDPGPPPRTRRASSMAGHDNGLGRRFEPIMAPALVDTFALRTLHQTILAALTADTAAWFGEVLRDYDEVGDLTDVGRRRMPAMMRGSDGLHLALTRRQVDTIRKSSARVGAAGTAPVLAQPAPAGDPALSPPGITPLNQTAVGASPSVLALEGPPQPPTIAIDTLVQQLAFRPAGNPAGTLLTTAISNCFPGLEFDFRNVWKRFFVEIELHEADNIVISAAEGFGELRNRRLLRVRHGNETIEIVTRVFGPAEDGSELDIEQTLEWSNNLASLASAAGTKVQCDFGTPSGTGAVRTRELTVRGLFVPGTAAIHQELAEPGELSQSLCSPWQNDYRECGCYYWAASRPDYVNVEVGPSGTSIGYSWLQVRGPNVPKQYLPEDNGPRFISYEDLFRRWEEVLRFEIGGNDSE